MSIINCQHKCMLIYTCFRHWERENATWKLPKETIDRGAPTKWLCEKWLEVPSCTSAEERRQRAVRNSILSMPLRAMTIVRLYLWNNTFHLKPHKELLSGRRENKSWTYYCIYFLWLSPGRVGEAVVAFADGCLLFGLCCFWVLINAMLMTSVTYTSEQRSSLTQCAARSEGQSTEIYHTASCWEEDRRERENTQSKAESVSLGALSLDMLEHVQTAPLVQDLS